MKKMIKYSPKVDLRLWNDIYALEVKTKPPDMTCVYH